MDSRNIWKMIRKNISLKKYNSFNIDVNAKEFVEVNSKDELIIFFNKFNPKSRYFVWPLKDKLARIIAAHPNILSFKVEELSISLIKWFTCFLMFLENKIL